MVYAAMILDIKKKTKGFAYIDLERIPPTGVIVERLFSTAERAYTDLRGRLDVVKLEAQLLLDVNRELWNLETVCSIVD
eukprot:541862-Amorphochlora_amoeboformis.AAC.1